MLDAREPVDFGHSETITELFFLASFGLDGQGERTYSFPFIDIGVFSTPVSPEEVALGWSRIICSQAGSISPG